MTCSQCSTIVKKWDLRITFPAIYKVHTYIRNNLYIYMYHASTACQVHSCCELIKPTMSVYIVREQLISHQPVVHTIAQSKDSNLCSMCALCISHMSVLQGELYCISYVTILKVQIKPYCNWLVMYSYFLDVKHFGCLRFENWIFTVFNECHRITNVFWSVFE